MCLARVDVMDWPCDQGAFMSDVARIEAVSDGLVLTSLMGEVREIRGRIRSIDFMKSVVLVEPQKGRERDDGNGPPTARTAPNPK